MAYLRWSYSNWYIYWDGMNDGLPKDDQLLFVLHKKVHDKDQQVLYTYDTLCDIKTINDLKECLGYNVEIPDEEYEEALEAIRAWIKDVDYAFSDKER